MFYHGTFSKCNIEGKLIPPQQHNFGINEDNRKIHSTRVFFTTVRGYVEAYARRCCKRVGGVPVVYEVVANNPKLLSKTEGCDVYYANEALIIEKIL